MPPTKQLKTEPMHMKSRDRTLWACTNPQCQMCTFVVLYDIGSTSCPLCFQDPILVRHPVPEAESADAARKRLGR